MNRLQMISYNLSMPTILGRHFGAALDDPFQAAELTKDMESEGLPIPSQITFFIKLINHVFIFDGELCKQINGILGSSLILVILYIAMVESEPRSSVLPLPTIWF